MEEIITTKKRLRDDSDESEFDTPGVKRLRDDLLECPDESDLCATSSDLDSFMKGFEKEISASPSPPPALVPAVDLTSDTGDGESQPDLRFLLEATDYELGLPPSTSLEDAPERVCSELGELWRFDDEIPSYDSFLYGHSYEYNGDGECLAYHYADLGFDFDDAPSPLWLPETMPAQ